MPPKGSKRGPDGQWISAVSQVATPHKKARTATGAKSSVTLSAEHAQLVKVPEVRKMLDDYVKSLAQAVDDDWHDSYEETDEMLANWLQDCAEQVGHVLQVGVQTGTGFDNCHEMLKIVTDTWSNIQAIPFRGCPEDSLGEQEGAKMKLGDSKTLRVKSAKGLVAYAWPLLLARAAADQAVTDAALMQMIKDAHDNGVTQPEKPHAKESIPRIASADLPEVVQRGRARVEQLVARKEEWMALPSTKKVHRMRRAIDRRFDGPLHRRTRDPRMFEDGYDGGDGCSLM